MVDKEVVGLIIQTLSMGVILLTVLPRQVRDMRIPGDVIDVVKIKRTMLFCSVALLIIGLPGLVRLLYLINGGEKPTPFDDVVFWSQRLFWPVVSYTGYMLYKGNQYQSNPNDGRKKARKN